MLANKVWRNTTIRQIRQTLVPPNFRRLWYSIILCYIDMHGHHCNLCYLKGSALDQYEEGIFNYIVSPYQFLRKAIIPIPPIIDQYHSQVCVAR